jgi:L-seryl-tRNA(Ser) seleniumtransferase
MEGFIHEPTAAELAALGRRAGVPVVEDLGSGALVDLAQFGVAHERMVQEAVNDGMSLVTFSGDKLLGGPQAGIIAGRNSFIARLKSNALLRAVRADKVTLAALRATLDSYRRDTWREEIPIYRMLAATLVDLRDRAAAYVAALPSAEILESDAYVGGGSLPESRIASVAVAIATPKSKMLAAALRRGDPPVVARIENDRLLIDLRAIAPDEDAKAIAAIAASMR